MKHQYYHGWYKNLPEDKKQKRVGYRRNHYLTHNK